MSIHWYCSMRSTADSPKISRLSLYPHDKKFLPPLTHYLKPLITLFILPSLSPGTEPSLVYAFPSPLSSRCRPENHTKGNPSNMAMTSLVS